jgi:hypothetical protein
MALPARFTMLERVFLFAAGQKGLPQKLSPIATPVTLKQIESKNPNESRKTNPIQIQRKPRDRRPTHPAGACRTYFSAGSLGRQNARGEIEAEAERLVGIFHKNKDIPARKDPEWLSM